VIPFIFLIKYVEIYKIDKVLSTIFHKNITNFRQNIRYIYKIAEFENPVLKAGTDTA